jgi:ATP-binding cassette subfamily C protein
MRQLDRHLKELGSVVRMGANQPIRLDREDCAFLVATGKIDLFSVTIETDRLVGARNFFCRVETGQLVFGLRNGESPGPIGILAVPVQDTELIRIDLTDLKSVSLDENYTHALSSLIDEWIVALYQAISRGVLAPKTYEALEPGKTIDVPTDIWVHTTSGVVWLTVEAGTLLLMGREDLPGIEHRQKIPVSESSWLCTVDRCTGAGVTTGELLGSGNDLWVALASFHGLIKRVIHVERKQDEAAVSEDYQAHREAETRFMENALASLSSVLARKADHLQTVAETPLLAVCTLVGQAEAIQVVAPPRRAIGAEKEDPLERIARVSRFRTREVLLEGAWWRKDNGALIGYLEEDDRPVALLPSRPGRYTLVDPTTEDDTVVDAAVAARLKPFARMLYRPFPDRPLTGKDVLRFGLDLVRKDLRSMLLMGILAGLVSLIVPILTRYLFDDVIPGEDRFQLVQIVGALALAAVASGLFLLVQAIAQLRVDGWLGATIQAAIWDRLLKVPVTFFRQFTAGDLVNRALGINQIQRLVSGAAVSTLISATFAGFNVALMFWFSWRLALVGLVIVAASLIFTAIAFRMQMRYQRPLFQVMGRIQGLVFQFITGISKLRVSAAENRAFYRWADQFARQKELDLKTRQVTNLVVVFSAILPLVGMIAVFGWFSVSETPALKILSTGTFLAFYAAFIAVLTAIFHSLTFLFPVLAVVPLYERTKPILVATPEVHREKASPHELTGHIELSHVSFRYSEDAPLVLKDLSLEVLPGEFVALVGPSGSGKTTLYRLLLGFEIPESGAIYYDGRDLSGLDVQSLRRQMGVVIQNGKLMTGTILSNIVGAARLTLDDAWEAARLCALEKDIRAMPMGMHTIIGEGGSGLSGGQRQRILIARAIATRPRIMLFDEATSALDNESQAAVSRSLARLQATRIVIAHRLSTVKRADKIHVLEQERIVESGTYEELMESNGAFAQLAQRQII